MIRPIAAPMLAMVLFAGSLASLPANLEAGTRRSEIVRAQAARATYVTSGSPWQHYGEQKRMVVGFVPNPALQKARGWVEFDLSALPSDAVVEGAALGLTRHGNDGPVNPVELRVVDQGRATIGASVTWDRLNGGGDLSGPLVAVLSPATAGTMEQMTALTTLPELQAAIERALSRTPRRLYLLLHSPEAEAQSAGGRYWRLGADNDLRPVLILQYNSAIHGEP